MKAKCLDPFTDFGFKKIFGQEASKPLLSDFLSALLSPTAQIQEMAFKDSEQAGTGLAECKVTGLIGHYCWDID